MPVNYLLVRNYWKSREKSHKKPINPSHPDVHKNGTLPLSRLYQEHKQIGGVAEVFSHQLLCIKGPGKTETAFHRTRQSSSVETGYEVSLWEWKWGRKEARGNSVGRFLCGLAHPISSSFLKRFFISYSVLVHLFYCLTSLNVSIWRIFVLPLGFYYLFSC